MSDIFQFYLVPFLFVFGLLVFVHEFGHFIMAKIFGVKVEEFGFGIPPRLIGKKIGETIYSLNWIPLGGFVKLFGEEGGYKKQKDSFSAQPLSQQAIILFAGVFMNFILAWGIFTTVLFQEGKPEFIDQIKIWAVEDDSPASEAGIKPGDLVVSLEEKEVKDEEVFLQIIEENRDKEVQLVVKHNDGLEEIISAVPQEYAPGKTGLGIRIGPDVVMVPVGFFQAIKLALIDLGKVVGETFASVKFLFHSLFFERAIPNQIAGPVGIVDMTSQIAREGSFLNLFYFAGILSVNLAVLNIMPFPALDGGRLLILAVEGLFKKELPESWKIAIHGLGFAFLLAFVFLVTLQDIQRLFTG